VGDDTLLGNGLDIRGDGGYAIVYELPDDLEIAQMPVWVKALAQKRRGSGLKLQGGFDPEQHRSGVPEGKRDNTIWSGACWHRAMDKPIEEALEWAKETALNSDFDPEIATEKVYRAFEQFEPNELYPETKPQADFDPLAEGITARDLQRKRFNPIRYAVEGYLPEGLTILGGKPKMGKSFMGLNLGVAKANGGEAIGEVPVTPGRAVILALEDNERRTHKRLEQMLGGALWPEKLELFYEWPRIGEGCEEALNRYLDAHPDTELIVIDTLKMIKPRTNGNRNAYDVDYEAVRPLLEIANKRHVAILVIHHLRKSEADDPLDEISGSTGLTGGVDGVMVLTRERGDADAFLYVTGRDIEEDRKVALTFDSYNATWQLRGDAAEYQLSKSRREIIEALKGEPPLSCKAIAEKLNKPRGTIAPLVSEMFRAGQLVQPKQHQYALPDHNPQQPQHIQQPQQGQQTQHSLDVVAPVVSGFGEGNTSIPHSDAHNSEPVGGVALVGPQDEACATPDGDYSLLASSPQFRAKCEFWPAFENRELWGYVNYIWERKLPDESKAEIAGLLSENRRDWPNFSIHTPLQMFYVLVRDRVEEEA
jgi:hypothetical protein